MSNIRICIDATPLLIRSAGVKTYVYYWIRHLQKLANPGQIGLFPLLGKLGDCVHEQSVASAPRTLAGLACLHLANYSPLPLLNWMGGRFDVFHASHQLTAPPRNTQLTATIYDMTCWLVPELHRAANVRGAKAFAERVMKRADGLIAISRSTRDDAVKVLGIPPEKIDVIYPGVAPTFFSATAPEPRLERPYILFVGTVEPRKNLPTLLDAYELLAPSVREQFDLVVAGPPGWGDPNTLQRLSSGIPGVRYLGYVSEEDLPALTAGATIFAYPSLYEGFGLPVAQAMAAGVPVITSGVSSLPEISGEAALLVDPRSPEDLRAAMEKLLLSPTMRGRMAEHGKLRAQDYRWENCARSALRFYEKVAG